MALNKIWIGSLESLSCHTEAANCLVVTLLRDDFNHIKNIPFYYKWHVSSYTTCHGCSS